MRINRNDLCWCNSGKKYKKCHMEFDERIENLAREGFEVPTRDIIKNEEQIEGIRKSAEINNAVLDLVAEKIKAGMSTEDINKIVHDYT
ncbi:MAG: SEC-C metal-binding domain-containing protein, partial [Clostridium perfringens]